MCSKIDPLNTTPTNEVGPETLSRFRYQASCAVFFAIDTLDRRKEIKEIYCEWHDDILIKMKNGKYRLCQVKSRRVTLNYLKTSEDEIIIAIKRFIEFEANFGSNIEYYYICSNQQFWEQDALSHENFKCFIGEFINKDVVFSQFKRWDVAGKLHVDTLDQFNLLTRVLKKIVPINLLVLGNEEMYLIQKIAQVPLLKGKPYGILNQIVKDLIDKCLIFSIKKEQVERIENYLFSRDPEQERHKAIIEGRKVTRSKILEIIQSKLNPSNLLRGTNHIEYPFVPGRNDKIVMKMNRGKIDEPIIDSVCDLANSFDTEILKWGYKNVSEADQKYAHLTSLLVSRWADEYAKYHAAQEPYGSRLWLDCLNALDRLLNDPCQELFGLNREQLKGCYGHLTQACKVWWSQKFILDAEIA